MEQSPSRTEELLSWSVNYFCFMEPAVSLPYSKQPAICPYVEPNSSSTDPSILWYMIWYIY